MANNWEHHTLDEISEVIISNVDKKTKAGEVPVRLCNYTDVYYSQFIRSNMTFMVATATEREIAKYSLFKGDVVITKDSETSDDIGVPAYIYEDIDRLVCGYHLVILRPVITKMNGAYLFYALCTQELQHQFHAKANGITRFGLRKDDIKSIQVPVPALPVQMRIADVLGKLDDKIELNRRMNRTLEKMAAAIFKSWFIDFDPVHAKAEGRDPYLPAELADLFPDTFEDSDLGLIPKGWDIKPLAEIVQLLSGGTPKTSEPTYWDGGIPWFSIKDAPSDSDVWVIGTERTITKKGLDNSAAQLLPERTTIISARGTVGRLALTGLPMAMNQSCYGVRGKEGFSNLFTYYAMRRATGQLQRHTHGTVFDTITRKTFETLHQVAPPPHLSIAFDGIVAPLLEKMRANALQSRTLACIRDTLLPKLLSGEIVLSEAEAITEEVKV